MIIRFRNTSWLIRELVNIHDAPEFPTINFNDIQWNSNDKIFKKFLKSIFIRFNVDSLLPSFIYV